MLTIFWHCYREYLSKRSCSNSICTDSALISVGWVEGLQCYRGGSCSVCEECPSVEFVEIHEVFSDDPIAVLSSRWTPTELKNR